MLVIADKGKPLALAGIMGGIESGVTLDTVDIFLESAFFDPLAISGKSFQLGFSSDSAYRFERGVDFAATKRVLERATQLIGDICGGKAGPITEIKNEVNNMDAQKADKFTVQIIASILLAALIVFGGINTLMFQSIKSDLRSHTDIVKPTPGTANSAN